MGVRLLRLFSILSTPRPKPADIQPTEQEQKALDFIGSEIQQGRSPSIRNLSKIIGFRSSRSGFRLLNRLIDRGFICRDQDKALHLGESIRDMEPGVNDEPATS
jgi:SOS-response transcriptional repressor LexA